MKTNTTKKPGQRIPKGYRFPIEKVERIERLAKSWNMKARIIVEKCVDIGLPILERKLDLSDFNSEIAVLTGQDILNRDSNEIVASAVQQELRRGTRTVVAGKRQSSQDAD